MSLVKKKKKKNGPFAKFDVSRRSRACPVPVFDPF
jgi:hypothetical protein